MSDVTDPEQQRAFALEVVERLRAGGHVAYWAGGCVRDRLLGKLPKDYDVATDAQPTRIRELFGRRHTRAVGAAFGVITVAGPKSTQAIEVATFREDAEYLDGRHPSAIRFSTPEADAERRDFTINGLFFDPRTESVIDFVGGQKDLELGIIRAIGDPRRRFEEDKLRLLRAVRFAATFNFVLEPATRDAVRSMAAEIRVVSTERIAGELRRMLTHANRRRAVELLFETGLGPQILPEMSHAAETVSPQWHQALKTLELLDEPSFSLALAALVAPLLSPDELHSVCRRLKLSNSEAKQATDLVDTLPTIENVLAIGWPKLQRILTADNVHDLLALAETRARAAGEEADSTTRRSLAHCRERLLLAPEELNPVPLLTGNDLIVHGISPGPKFQTLLELVRDAQLEKRVQTRGEALALVDRILSDH